MADGLGRFLQAQGPVYPAVLRELRSGRKTSHWMWFVFPQLRGLGQSATAVRFGIADRDEAVAYLEDAVLGARLLECAGLVLDVAGRTAHEIFGSPDDMKLRSCVTLFAAVSGEGVFPAVLGKYYGGVGDARTLAMLAGS